MVTRFPEITWRYYCQKRMRKIYMYQYGLASKVKEKMQREE